MGTDDTSTSSPASAAPGPFAVSCRRAGAAAKQLTSGGKEQETDVSRAMPVPAHLPVSTGMQPVKRQGFQRGTERQCKRIAFSSHWKTPDRLLLHLGMPQAAPRPRLFAILGKDLLGYLLPKS